MYLTGIIRTCADGHAVHQSHTAPGKARHLPIIIIIVDVQFELTAHWHLQIFIRIMALCPAVKADEGLAF